MSDKSSSSGSGAGILMFVAILGLIWLSEKLNPRCVNRGGELVILTCIKKDAVIHVDIKQPEKP